MVKIFGFSFKDIQSAFNIDIARKSFFFDVIVIGFGMVIVFYYMGDEYFSALKNYLFLDFNKLFPFLATLFLVSAFVPEFHKRINKKVFSFIIKPLTKCRDNFLRVYRYIIGYHLAVTTIIIISGEIYGALIFFGIAMWVFILYVIMVTYFNKNKDEYSEQAS